MVVNRNENGTQPEREKKTKQMKLNVTICYWVHTI